MKILEDYFSVKDREWESLCIRCGACCGAYDDPCVHLKGSGPGQYYCDIYEHRLGERITRAGEKFDCVPVKEILHTWWPGSHICAYKKKMGKKK